jgi:hypothetical protein
MQKIPTLFARNPDDRRHVLTQVTPGCEWVLAREGTATRKYDGTCVMFNVRSNWWARREVKPGKKTPPNYTPISTDSVTGKTVGWEPIEQSSFAKYFDEAQDVHRGWPVGTYELCGPKINGNPEALERHTLIRHATAETVAPEFDVRTYEGIADFLSRHHWEGIVYHHPDGRRAKIKTRDFPRIG